ncbi:hypothetical protein AUG19_05075 [archaeon 13_1_20CM_2_54_9]|nr:MAG: hypothetical protein AUG19_05075 [archaeon 13_1_20CM_2_54_9]TMI28064.1 MAG: hypothetical protein E6H36_01805 [Candidatus Bathyarchaeota archaeon]TMI31094.1 MAG: hypothetical protein E6H29_06750 [Candidatus Bathyarchaeota archaeon]
MPLQFRSSGIRGRYPTEVGPSVASELARALCRNPGTEVSLGRDPRFSGPVLKASFSSAALEAEAHILDYDLVPTPALSFETRARGNRWGVMITASHNPPQYNGFKVFNAKGEAVDDVTELRSSPRSADRGKNGVWKYESARPTGYKSRLATISFDRKWKVVVDPGNGAASELAPEIYGNLLDSATSINSMPDGEFSARGSEPTRQSTRMLQEIVTKTGAMAGVAFDGDADRMVLVDEKGDCPLQDRVLGAYIRSLALRSKGPFLIPLDASMAIDEVVEKHGGRIIRGPVGDAKLLREVKRWKASFAGEPSGAWIHTNFNPCPDGILSGLLFLKAVEEDGDSVSAYLDDVPEYYMIRRSLLGKLRPGKAEWLANHLGKVVGAGSSISDKYGLRVSTDKSWVLVRESGTEPVIRVTGESKERAGAARIIRETLRLVRQALKGKPS